MTPIDFDPKAQVPQPDIAPVGDVPAPAEPLPVGRRRTRRSAGPYQIDLATQKLREVWRLAPKDLKLIALVIPLVLLLTLNAAGPRLYAKPVAMKSATQFQPEGLLARQWHAFRKNIARRAKFDYADDFRSGLDAWTFPGGSAATWSYDKLGVVRPGALALFRPTLAVANCHVEFVARIDKKGLGFVFRAADANNYEAVRLVIANPGPLAEVRMIRYAVVNGHESSRSEKPLPVALSIDNFFTVRIEVSGGDFTLMVQDKVVDSWSDDRLRTGGVGFFCGKGEQARLRRVDVSYQNDTLGRLCAFLAFDSTEDNNTGN